MTSTMYFHSITWAIINSTMSLADAGLITYELRCYYKYLTRMECFGKGMIGWALILTIAPIISNGGMPYMSRAGNPFNVWPSFLLRVGIMILFTARIIRHRRHERNNAAQIKIAEAYLANKRDREALRKLGEEWEFTKP